MRLRRLDLLRYGRFADVSLELPARPLVVVHGPNEAGKTSALEAVADLLFGFPHLARQSFRHDPRELRVGAELEAPDGRRLIVVRRRGRKGTLLGAEGQALGDDALQSWLGGCTPDVFHGLFGLDQRRLREGGLELLKGGGALGESLLSAGEALRGAGRLRTELREEADALFRTTASRSTRFAKAQAAHREAREALRDATVTPRAYAAAAEEAEAAEAAAEAARAGFLSLQEADLRDQRMMGVAPILARLDALAARRTAYAELEDVGAGAAAMLREAMETAAAAARDAESAARTVGETEATLAATPEPSPALGRAAEIEALVVEKGRIEALGAALPAARAELAEADATLAERAARLGLAPDAFEALTPTDPEIAALRAAATEAERTAALAEAAEARAREAARRLSALGEVEPAEEDDAAALRAALPELKAAPRLEAEAAAARRAAEAAEAEAEAAAAALSPRFADAAALAAFAPPSEAAVRSAREAFRAQAQAEQEIGSRRARLAEARAAAEAALRAAQAGDAPSRAALDAARAERDRLWRALRRVAVEGGAGEAPEPDAYEARVAEADRLADARETHAAAIAAEARARAELVELDAAAAALEAEARAAAAARAETEARWRALWDGLSAEPDPPEDMAEWLRARAAALVRREEARRRAEAAAEAGARAERARAELARRAAGQGFDPAAPSGELLEALERTAEAGEAREAARRERRAAEAALAEAEAERERATAAASAADEALAPRLEALRIDPALGAKGVEAAISLWAAVPQARRERARLAERIEREAAELARLTEAAAALAEAAGTPRDAGPAVVAEAARRRLREDERAAAERRRLSGEIARLRAAAERAAEEAARAAAALEERTTALGGAGATPEALLERLEARDALEAELAAARAALAEQGAERSEAALRAALGGLDVAALEARIAARAEEREAAEARWREALSAREAKSGAVEALKTRGAAAEAAQARVRDAAAEMGEAAQEWLTLHAADLLLQEATRRWRDQHRDPVLERAGALFRTITHGAFVGLEAEPDEEGEDRLVAVRESGERLRFRKVEDPRAEAARSSEPFSEGTLDQLFLALRLAAVERRCSAFGPLPFLADDLFASFDDARTAAGLAALAELGGRTQTLVFTHHEALADAAAEMGPAAAVVRLPV